MIWTKIDVKTTPYLMLLAAVTMAGEEVFVRKSMVRDVNDHSEVWDNTQVENYLRYFISFLCG